MTNMGVLLNLFCILVTLCGLTRLIIGITSGEKSRAAQSVIAAVLKKIFTFASLPCLLFGAAIVTADFFANGADITKLVITALCAALSAFVTFALSIRQSAPYYSGIREERTEHKAAFEFAGVWNEAVTVNTAEHRSFSRFAADTVLRLKEVCNQIEGYISFQKEHCSSILEKRLECENIFTQLVKIAKECIDSFSNFQARLNTANDALLYFENDSSKYRIEDLRWFIENLQERTNKVDEQIEGLKNKLQAVALETSGSAFLDFARPYSLIIGNYTTRLESALAHIEEKNRISANLERKIKISAELEEIITVIGKAAEELKKGIDAFKRDAEAKIEALREELSAAARRTAEAERRAESAEAQMKTLEKTQAGITTKGYEALQKKYRKALLGIAAGVFAVIITIFVAIGQNNKIKDLYNSASLNYEQLEQEFKTLEQEFESSKTIWEVHATSLKIGNADKNNKWITKPGEPISADDVRLLNPYLTVDSLLSGNRTFYIKIIEPDGTINSDPAVSPEGYSFQRVRNLAAGKNQEIDLDGWGNGDQSIYKAGTYTVEVWYEGVRLITGNFTLD
ncbi:MAG: hypothetical protein LBD18_06670 [Treponema sp.]|jgi:hypothetical protein|nr:hypothetical protein [Treponema sp.]